MVVKKIKNFCSNWNAIVVFYVNAIIPEIEIIIRGKWNHLRNDEGYEAFCK